MLGQCGEIGDDRGFRSGGRLLFLPIFVNIAAIRSLFALKSVERLPFLDISKLLSPKPLFNP